MKVVIDEMRDEPTKENEKLYMMFRADSAVSVKRQSVLIFTNLELYQEENPLSTVL